MAALARAVSALGCVRGRLVSFAYGWEGTAASRARVVRWAGCMVVIILGALRLDGVQPPLRRRSTRPCLVVWEVERPPWRCDRAERSFFGVGRWLGGRWARTGSCLGAFDPASRSRPRSMRRVNAAFEPDRGRAARKRWPGYRRSGRRQQPAARRRRYDTAAGATPSAAPRTAARA